ncbi:MAG: peptidoglycan DD-metalloendopeptidase family protein [Pseudomonadales bacterium]|nr:peptidoglycan DD-metalloendopeptidase family protein [Pseudomonadales bacterium]
MKLVLALLLFSFAAITYGETTNPIPGGIYRFKIPTDATNVAYRDKAVFAANGWALVAIPIATEPGESALTYEQNGAQHTHSFTIHPHAYTEQHITIKNEALVSPPPEVQERIQRESVRQRGLYASHRTDHKVANGFQLPLNGITTSLFGHKRFFNGKPRSPHSGLDIAADSGTPIGAAGGGTVTLADELYFNGNTIFIDHGRGLITMYCHMSKLEVAENEEVSKGQTIGLVGATGRATGPHLHWSVSLNGTRVDPTIFAEALNQTVTSLPN